MGCFRDKAEVDTMAAYAAQRDSTTQQGLAKREIDVRKIQLQMDPYEQAAEGRQQVRCDAAAERPWQHGLLIM